MGQAFDKYGDLMGEVEGSSKSEVFEKLQRDFPTAAELRIREDAAAKAGDVAEQKPVDQADGSGSDAPVEEKEGAPV